MYSLLPVLFLRSDEADPVLLPSSSGLPSQRVDFFSVRVRLFRRFCFFLFLLVFVAYISRLNALFFPLHRSLARKCETKRRLDAPTSSTSPDVAFRASPERERSGSERNIKRATQTKRKNRKRNNETKPKTERSDLLPLSLPQTAQSSPPIHSRNRVRLDHRGLPLLDDLQSLPLLFNSQKQRTKNASVETLSLLPQPKPTRLD